MLLIVLIAVCLTGLLTATAFLAMGTSLKSERPIRMSRWITTGLPAIALLVNLVLFVMAYQRKEDELALMLLCAMVLAVVAAGAFKTKGRRQG